MEYRKVKLLFAHSLSSEQQRKLISHFKGLAKATKDGIKEQKKMGSKFMKIPFMDRIAAGSMMAARLDSLIIEYEKDGRMTTPLDEMFNLEFDSETPELYVFSYPFMPSLLGIDSAFKMLSKAGLKMDFRKFISEEEKMVRSFCADSGIAAGDIKVYEASKFEG